MTFSSGTNTERMRILAGGNVGIGTTDPDANLHINGSYNNWAQIINTGSSLIGFVNADNGGNANRPGISFGRNMTDLNNQKARPNIYSYNHGSNPALVTTATTSRLEILSNGVVQIGVNGSNVPGSTYLQIDRRMELVSNNSVSAGIWFNHSAGTERNFFGNGSHSGSTNFDGLGMYYTSSGGWRNVFLRN